METAIRTERLLLRKIVATDIDKVYEGLSHPLVIKHYGVNYKTLEETEAQMEWYAEKEEKQTGRFWAVCIADSGEFIGTGGLYLWSKLHEKAEAGFWLLPEYWGIGYMTEAMNAIVAFGFDQMGLHRIEGFVESDNLLCKRAMDKLDFTLEGTMHECEVKNGKRISLDIYAKIKPSN
ncbi:MAG: GNAT family N-acetyltransferase [Saprospiraceae bacterium]|nr:GNAT family N-acetyltransferase [Saprospiraceae bacterium]